MSDQAEATQERSTPENVEGETPRPRPLPPEVAARRDAALKQVRRYGDPVLKTKAIAITRFDDELRAEVQRMGQLMDEALGIGLAAPQVGISHRLVIYRVVHGGPLSVLVNPVLEWSSKEDEWMEEGCLSLPAVHVDVERPVHVRVVAQDPYGAEQTIEASGLEARVIQHEMDHLDGVLILDRTPRGQRKEAMRALREALAAPAAPVAPV
ncbi:MAG: Peptide deformylase [uncultured Solirubrobacteraceae bacterium]|uniref:Peptide deformylase n=1 Tax=uncultured Solirubrobacteraceae bacterium TaxID=1162706 RepID=A0A6J4T5G6_9ACTN|nr:MAG: Peptide deformylase [uncultured Solirubrobacteraceae bacterium]